MTSVQNQSHFWNERPKWTGEETREGLQSTSTWPGRRGWGRWVGLVVDEEDKEQCNSNLENCMKVSYKDDGGRLLEAADGQRPQNTSAGHQDQHLSEGQQYSTGPGYSERWWNLHPQKFSSLSQTKPWLTWSSNGESNILRLPKASFSQHFYAFTESVGFSWFIPCYSLPTPTWKSDGWIGFFSHLGNIID